MRAPAWGQKPWGDARLLVVNLGRDLPRRPASEPLLAMPEGMGWTMLWSSEDPRYKGGGTAPLAGEHGWQLPAHTAVVLRPRVPAEPEGASLPSSR